MLPEPPSLCLKGQDPGSGSGQRTHQARSCRRPTSLWEAYHALEEDDVVKNALGEKVFNQFYTIKRAEWDAYRIQVFDYERDQYLDV